MTTVKFRAWGPPTDHDPMGREFAENPKPVWVRGELVEPGVVRVGNDYHQTTVGDLPGQYKPLRQVRRNRRAALAALADAFSGLTGPEARGALLALKAVLKDDADRDSAAEELIQRITQAADSRKPMLGLCLAVVLLADKIDTIDEE